MDPRQLKAVPNFVIAAAFLLVMLISLTTGPLFIQPSGQAFNRELSMRIGSRTVVNGISTPSAESETVARNAARDTVVKRARGRESAVFAIGAAIAFGVGLSARSRREE